MASETKLERRYARRRVSEGKRARKSLARGAEHGIKERGQGSRWERRTDTAAVAGEADPIGASADSRMGHRRGRPQIPEWSTPGANWKALRDCGKVGPRLARRSRLHDVVLCYITGNFHPLLALPSGPLVYSGRVSRAFGYGSPR